MLRLLKKSITMLKISNQVQERGQHRCKREGQELGGPKGQDWGVCAMGPEDKLQAPWSCCVRSKCSLGNVCSPLPLDKYLYIHLPSGALTWLLTSSPA